MGNDVHLLDKWYRKDSNKVIRSRLTYIKMLQVAVVQYACLDTATNCSSGVWEFYTEIRELCINGRFDISVHFEYNKGLFFHKRVHYLKNGQSLKYPKVSK